ncbi:AcrR family transcriptional regulator [Diaminobutyricimonas aerilata]|uniref:AcrR family transcriptional regulator n=1 Tax=Diaminobutyricimonas aerilata TaxID=1162967 RepID=A0A2M9CLR5_9MICO|nr:TetR/AcrR family transcriptional regulator [Diaminobutyricimonas aerilata]PJJ72831.1 AcrR family transcriptional regulator [Diaminobutyricimonas aerilata]
MPRHADHGARRRQITGAARTLIARDGLSSASFANVSAEAGVSVRLIQYYFGDKKSLLHAVFQAVIGDIAARFPTTAFDGATTRRDPRETVLTILEALLPMTAAQRADAIVLASFHAATLTTADVETRHTTEPLRILHRELLPVLTDAASGEPSPDDTAAIADALLLASTGLAQSMLAGYTAPDNARRILRLLVARLIPSTDT